MARGGGKKNGAGEKKWKMRQWGKRGKEKGERGKGKKGKSPLKWSKNSSF